MADQLVDFLRTKKEQAPRPEMDWQAKRDAWVGSVKSLYERVKEMLRDSIASEDVMVSTFDIEVTEDFIGTYSIPALKLTVGTERVEFLPKGVTIIGAAGRVDIRGERDAVTLIKDSADVDSGWAVVLQRVPNRKTVPLDRESLRNALEQVMLPLP